ncbi:Mitochondrial pyruvate carrier 3 [Sesamum angolense]|uniref:Mitochondrial pyruvate carrier n=1 Tax=Sesamum angolense TaxID=2727404 RepID=A0AAE1WSJ3_9LAMI|nr:Mitochondrial pyruvate carrier 3 [Sesamum angolense]
MCLSTFWAAVAVSGLIWARYSTIVTPKNWNLFSVSVGMSATGIYQLARKTRQDYDLSEKNVGKGEGRMATKI